MVELVGVTKRFDDFVAVGGVDLLVRGGEFLTLLGPSGCGKTTLLRMISGFETPTTGSVRLEGRDVTALPPYRRDVNQVFQSYALFPHLSVRDNVAFGLRMKGTPGDERSRRVAEGIELVGLAGMEARKPHQLSGGQRQRVALARALVCRPKVLLLDEPLAALDAKLRRSMQVELKRLQQRVGITFVFVTHDQDEAMVMSDRVAVMNAGRVEQIGPPHEVYRRPGTRFVADFLGQTNLLPAVVARATPEGTEMAAGVAGEIRVALSNGALPPGAVDGGWVLSVRPERVRVEAFDRAGAVAGGVPATVTETLFRGATTQLTLRTDGGTILAALLVNEAGGGGVSFTPGGRVGCSVSAEDVVALRGT